jgi:hypothetical protein
MKISMQFKKETKGALVYEEIDNGGNVIDFGLAKIGTLYVRKKAFTGSPPRISVTLDTEGTEPRSAPRRPAARAQTAPAS